MQKECLTFVALLLLVVTSICPRCFCHEPEGPSGFLADAEAESISFLDNKRIVTSSSNGELSIWNVESGRRLGRFLVGNKTHIHSIRALSPDKIVAVSNYRDVILVDLANESTVNLFSKAVDICSISLILDAKRIVCACANGVVSIDDLETKKEVAQLEAPFKSRKARAIDVSVSCDNIHLAAAYDNVWNSEDSQIIVWNIEKQKSVLSYRVDSVWARAVSFDPKRSQVLAFPNTDNTGLAFGELMGEQLGKLENNRIGRPYLIRFSPVNSDLIATCFDGSIYLIRKSGQKKVLAKLDPSKIAIYDVAFSTSGRYVAFRAFDTTTRVIVFDTQTGKQLDLK